MKKVASIARLTPDRVMIIRIARGLLDAKIQIAYRDGYIARFREAVSTPADPVDNPDSVEKLRRIVGYSPDREASAIIEALSPALLDKILGKPDDE